MVWKTESANGGFYTVSGAGNSMSQLRLQPYRAGTLPVRRAAKAPYLPEYADAGNKATPEDAYLPKYANMRDKRTPPLSSMHAIPSDA